MGSSSNEQQVARNAFCDNNEHGQPLGNLEKVPKKVFNFRAVSGKHLKHKL